jgi:hypothetical protein
MSAPLAQHDAGRALGPLNQVQPGRRAAALRPQAEMTAEGDTTHDALMTPVGLSAKSPTYRPAMRK